MHGRQPSVIDTELYLYRWWHDVVYELRVFRMGNLQGWEANPIHYRFDTVRLYGRNSRGDSVVREAEGKNSGGDA